MKPIMMSLVIAAGVLAAPGVLFAGPVSPPVTASAPAAASPASALSPEDAATIISKRLDQLKQGNSQFGAWNLFKHHQPQNDADSRDAKVCQAKEKVACDAPVGRAPAAAAPVAASASGN